MFSLETFESQISAVMDTLVEAAVLELDRLLNECSAEAMAAQHRSAAAAAVKEESDLEESGAASPEDRQQQFNKVLTKQFASLMEAWSKGAVEKISLMWKVSMCEAEDAPAVEQRAGLHDKMKRTSRNLKGGTKKATSTRHERTDIQGGIQSVRRKKNDHVYCREEQPTEEPVSADSEAGNAASHEESNSGPCSEPEAVLTAPEPVPDVRKEAVQDDIDSHIVLSKKTAGAFKCPSCEKTFPRKCLMDRHYLTHSKPHHCSECGKRFAGRRGLIAHSRRHTGEKLYKCSDCGTEFAYKSTFHRHMRHHDLEKPNTYTCMLCENQFTGILALQRHRCCALKKTFVCSLCPETFECRQSLADHENRHPGHRDFVCEMCGERFFSSSSLATHRVTHTQKKNCCDVLGLGCSDMSVLKIHLSKHTGEKLFTCEVCGKGCSHRSALKHHMLTHTGERPYICETCGKRCGHASALQNHMRIHTGKKPGQQPVCDQCGKTFSSMVNLKYHMSTHTGEKPYACDQCDKKFRNPSNLKLHMTVHSGEKMYGCNICGRRFTQSNSLKLHRLLHTGERPYRCTVCGKEFMYSSVFKKHQRDHVAEEAGGRQSENTAVKI